MHLPPPLTQDIVLIGGGHAHALVLRQWGMRPVSGVRLTLIDPNPSAPYTGMLPGYVAGHYDRDDLEIDLVRLARFAGARLILGRAVAIDRTARDVILSDGRRLAYDYASVDIGISSTMPDLPGFAEHAIAAKPLGGFAAAWSEFATRSAENSAPARIATIGGGVAGVELALAMAHRLRRQKPEIAVIDATTALTGMAKRPRAVLDAALSAHGVTVHEHAAIDRISERGVHLGDQRLIEADFVVGAAGARPYDWLADTGLGLHDGYLKVGPTLQTEDPRLFAVGDCAHMHHAPRPKAGVFAVRQAPVLYANLRALVTGAKLLDYAPQKDFLKLISLGGKKALAEKAGLAFHGGLMWRWKDRIDQSFMAKFAAYPDMPKPQAPAVMAQETQEILDGSPPVCGGCGAKIGAAALFNGLSELSPSRRDDVIASAGDDAAILRIGDVTQVITTDHLREFCADPAMMARITAVHALGDIWAMGAAPQAVLSQITLPPMTPRLQSRTLSEITKAATEVFAPLGAEIVGGHTTTGHETCIGFTITGLSDTPIRNAGAVPGDALILTKPIGSGVLLAAEMSGAAQGRDIAAAFDIMAQPQAAAAKILATAHAMTDVTGFGLIGHLNAMLNASNTGAEIDLNAIPLMPGALAAAKSGIRPSLYDANRTGAPDLSLPDDPRVPLLFDPQTGGGLLAAVPPKDAETMCRALQNAKFSAARIGTVTESGGLLIRC